MSTDEWFRNSTWDVEIEKAFFGHLARSRTQRDQYLIIQALTLAQKHPEVTLRLVELYSETAKSEFEHVRALLARVEALLALERIDDALTSMKEVLLTEQRRPTHKTRVFVDYPFLVATRKLRPEYDHAMLTLEGRSRDIMFPIDRFMWHASASLIHGDRQETAQAKEHADALELAQQVGFAVRKGSFAHQRQSGTVQLEQQAQSVPENGSNGASITSKPIDKLVFFGPQEEAKAVERLLSRLDVPYPQIEIVAGIYEFQRTSTDGSAVNAAINLLGSKIGFSIDGGTSYGSSLKLALPSMEAALSVLDSDSRFKYVARPKVMVMDGQQASFTSGQDVRVDGQATVGSNGQVVTSKTTVTAGVTLQATPYIRGDVVDMTLHQVVSDFVASPNDDPSMVRRDLSTRLLMEPGSVYVIGGLQTNRKTVNKRSLFGWRVANEVDSTGDEVVILLMVRPEPQPTKQSVGLLDAKLIASCPEALERLLEGAPGSSDWVGVDLHSCSEAANKAAPCAEALPKSGCE